MAGIPAFGYLLYLTGKTYSVAYYSTIGIPNDILSFGFWDCIYFGAKDFNILIPLAFAFLFVCFVLYLTASDQGHYKDRYFRLMYAMYIFYFFLMLFTLVWVCAKAWLNPISKTSLEYIGGALLACFGVWLFSIGILTDKAFSARTKEGKIVSWLFPIAIAIALVLFPNTSADAWGRLEGMRAEDSHQLVELHAHYPLIDDIHWELTSTNSSRTVDNLYLLFSNQQYLVVESVTDGHSLYVVMIDDILSIKVIETENK